ncbi:MULTISPECIES: glycoside hydrolase family 130 protein [Dyadobacter]|uniref:Glycoside hydrolase family 130 protein n=1 Tax=Dyadobacter chenhuakuii TaxID=2909339 RepID=A0A9X1QED9_9BACT|nr:MULTISPECIES: glycoside hydrolase family 130 protein [Dyadobacter]MCF2492897.1 glycoside hydrolase family 130 protein [Dyadobacter chenhuakuii]MCF2498957.1 glycoside hydrolase family 130 protein [Dyadobacter chenhuakuii]MCF2517727.1 glycoside hydrolase family 130 protein [Dyadobacter sp. CY351]USJ32813.1 glycoside hydrolase family 130 protein [Dyadobacter chenhuakuii]
MSINITRKDIVFQPDSSRVIARFMFSSEERARQLITMILNLSQEQQKQELSNVLRKYAKRHRNILRIFERHFHRLHHVLSSMDIDLKQLGTTAEMLIGSFFTMEYSIEAAAFFNPSIVEDPDQSRIGFGERRVILSFRATGEGHISSIVFRSAIIDRDNLITVEPPGRMLDSPAHVRNHVYKKKTFLAKLGEMQNLENAAYPVIEQKLTETFTYEELKRYVDETNRVIEMDEPSRIFLREMMWLASSHYEMDFSLDTDISERVIFPIADTEKRGIEDARFVKFMQGDNEPVYYATYTAYDGISILPKILMTKDFYHFKVLPIHGEIAQNKGMALFPRKINGKYAMLCRIDGVNNYIAFSDNISVWRQATMIQSPKFPWEFVQIGNCGSPLETEAGWLVLTHGVGPMREYVLGASLFELDNPEKEIGRLSQPLLIPNRKEREGYVPNVVYSCGALIHNESLIIPYAMSDYASTYVVVDLKDLLKELTQNAGLSV